MSLFSKQKIGIAIASVATASFVTGFIGAEQALKQRSDVETAQPLQPALYDVAQRALWQVDIGLNQVNRQIQLAERQSEIARSRYSHAHSRERASLRESYAGESLGSTSNRSLEAMQSNRLQLDQDFTAEPLTDPLDQQIGAATSGTATVPDASIPDSSTAQTERYTSESAEYSTSTDHRLESESGSRSLKPDFGWPGSPEFIEDYIKASAIK